MNIPMQNAMNVPTRWQDITVLGESDWPFSLKGCSSSALIQRCSGPRIYRFFFDYENGWADCYVGESEDFAKKRLGQYKVAVKNARPTKDVPESADIDWVGLNLKMKDQKERRKLFSDTEVGIASLILNAEKTGRKVALSALDFDAFHINRIEICPDKLDDMFLRRMIENLMILIESAQPNVRILNRGHDASGSFLGKLISKNAKDSLAAHED